MDNIALKSGEIWGREIKGRGRCDRRENRTKPSKKEKRKQGSFDFNYKSLAQQAQYQPGEHHTLQFFDLYN